VRILYSSRLSYLFLALLCISTAYGASAPNIALGPVSADLAVGKADDAISRLSATLAADPADAEAHNLLCRVYYQEERWDDAIHECETAVRLMPTDSGYHLWLGRAYGEKADSIHSIKAYGLAKKVRDEFERAVQLDGENVDALSDLGDFYTAAPGIVGGGKKKAQGVGAPGGERQELRVGRERVQVRGRGIKPRGRRVDVTGLVLCTPAAMGPDAGSIACGDRCGRQRCETARARFSRRGFASQPQSPGAATCYPVAEAVSRFAESIGGFARFPGPFAIEPVVGAAGRP
jgi:hypothetical protein